MNLFEFQLLKHSATGQSFSEDSSDLQAALHNLAGGFLVLIEGVGVDVQCSRWLTVSEQSSNCADVRAAGDEQACCRVAQAVNIQVYVFAKQCQHVYVMDMCQNEAFISRKIRINAIAPGSIDTPMTTAGRDPAEYEETIRKMPLHRRGRPEELVGPAVLLLSDAGAFMVGTTLDVNGGSYLY